MKKVILVVFGSLSSKALYEENYKTALEKLKEKFSVDKAEIVLFEDCDSDMGVEAGLLGLFRMLTDNSKKTDPDQIVIVSTRDRGKDESIWEWVKNYPKNSMFVYGTEEGFFKVEGFKKIYFEGEEFIFSSKK
ncbi:MAG TPA: hypothetical protein PKH95_03180 [Candidatus Magasanikbacteria bacterium]|nr:hypothetical protein [Candidatus Magasanikbacteria bacterium]